jgi:Zn-dependent protease with chaperone function
LTDNLYPPSIQGAPSDLTKPSSQYRRQVVIVLACLAIFILFYFGLIAGCIWAVYQELQFASGDHGTAGGRADDHGLAVAATLAVVLLIFLVKAQFKWHRQKDDTRIEITEKEHPSLFQFIRGICEDTRAPFPKRVFVTPDVNASVFYNSSLLSLVLPVKKNLVIGMGLVNGLNLSEFKAVLAHEFGHFSQSSMRLGSYVYMANRVIYDLVYHRDVFDDLLAKARRTNIRIAIFAWMATFVLWLLRMLLQLAFRVINIFESALSRQMEFHADLVAVSITGSDALIHALKKLDFINACLMQAMSDLKDASEHGLFTADLFYHQSLAVDHLRRITSKTDLGIIPELPADPAHKVELFTKEEGAGEHEGMWASHPSHYDREQNAKRHYLRSPEDTRSPWLLFSDSEQLRRKMTALFYRHILDFPADLSLVSPEKVQTFIEDEHQETNQDPRYAGMYDGRLLSIPPDVLTEYANDPSIPTMPEKRIRALVEKQYDSGMKDWIETHGNLREESGFLEGIASGETKIAGSTFEFRGRTYPKPEAKGLLETVEAELKADSEFLKQFDREVLQVHLRMAQIVGDGDRDLFERYYFHLHLQEMLKSARQEELRLVALFQFVASKHDGLSKKEFAETQTVLSDAHGNILNALRDYGSVPLPALQNMTTGASLASCLLEQSLVAALPGGQERIDGNWVSGFMKQVSQIEERARRLYFKSMGAILARQEVIAAAWRERQLDGSA